MDGWLDGWVVGTPVACSAGYMYGDKIGTEYWKGSPQRVKDLDSCFGLALYLLYSLI